MPFASAGASAAAAAAAVQRMMQQEEEEMTPYAPGDLDQYEFKIIRSAAGQFRHPEKFRAFLEEEAKAGWELVEKFDGGRARLRRKVSWRAKDADLGWDAYRTVVGMGEGRLVALILVSVFGGLFAAGALIFLLLKAN